VLIGALVTVAAASPSAPALVEPVEQEIGLLFVQTATGGTLEPGEDGSGLALTLSGVTPQVVWFSDRPARASGQIAVPAFVDLWEGYGFVAVPPNAALSLLDAEDAADTVVVELGPPEWDADAGTLRYPASLLNEATGNLSHFASDIDAGVGTSFGPAALFIDDATGKVIDGCLIQRYAWCQFAKLSNADLSGVDLFTANLHGADLRGANLSNAILFRADLSRANLSNADLSNANLASADLSEANLRGATLSGATLDSARFCRTMMPNGTRGGC
jgi:hypothetical protein